MSEAKVRKYIAVAGILQTQKLVLNKILDGLNINSQLTDEEVSSIVEALVPVYVKHVPEETLDKLITLFDSDEGRYLLSKLEEIFDDSQKACEGVVGKILTKKVLDAQTGSNELN